jgi:potassium uptake TrkH family protein
MAQAAKVIGALLPLTSLAAIGFVVYDLGFHPFFAIDRLTTTELTYCLILFKLLMIVQFIEGITLGSKKFSSHLYNFALIVLVYFLHSLLHDLDTMTMDERGQILWKKSLLYIGLAYLFFNHASTLFQFVYIRRLNPAFIFMASFGGVILLGSLLLLLPNATTKGISYLDALFMSASAVCVTGLTVVDTGNAFTGLGHTILLFLIQIGGLGIMTFTGLFSFLAAGSVSIQNQVALKDMLSANRMSSVVQMVSRIVMVTLFFEGIGALLIHWALEDDMQHTRSQRFFFSIFHSVSAFCNAGFSTLSDGLYTKSIRFNYTIQLVVAGLIILGGLGFPIVFNLFTFIRIRFMNTIRRVLKIPQREQYIRLISINSRLVIVTTLVLLSFGFFGYLLFEQEGTLSQHPTTWGKAVTAFFGSVTPRTAGFNTVNLAALTLPTTLIYLLLMWVGASPGSTGGGIRNTTASVALLNIISTIRGKSRTEVFRVQLSQSSINRAFAIIVVSLLFIGLATLALSVSDTEKGILPLAFESFSAFSTVGLSLGITAAMSSAGKVVLIILMFVGRVGALTVLIAFVNQSRPQNYMYPKEDILY